MKKIDYSKLTKKELVELLKKKGEYQRNYFNNPENKERHRQYQREYAQRPEIKERQRKHKRMIYAAYKLAKEKGLI